MWMPIEVATSPQASSMTEAMSPSKVFSIRPLTIRAEGSLSGTCSLHVIIGVLMILAALMISLIRGTPKVTFMAATPAKWKVFNVICVPGSPIDCAPTAPTVDPIKGESQPTTQFLTLLVWLTRFNQCSVILVVADVQERNELQLGHPHDVVNDSEFRSCTWRCQKERESLGNVDLRVAPAFSTSSSTSESSP
jgi:hypothetical protein